MLSLLSSDYSRSGAQENFNLEMLLEFTIASSRRISNH